MTSFLQQATDKQKHKGGNDYKFRQYKQSLFLIYFILIFLRINYSIFKFKCHDELCNIQNYFLNLRHRQISTKIIEYFPILALFFLFSYELMILIIIKQFSFLIVQRFSFYFSMEYNDLYNKFLLLYFMLIRFLIF